jgi:chromosome segregation ATPase
MIEITMKHTEIPKNYKIEIEQLKAALEASKKYADKLVAGIPYLPADIENLRESNVALVTELNHTKFNIDHTQEEIEDLRESNVELVTELNDATLKIDNMQEEVEYHRAEVRRMRDDLSTSISERAVLQGHIDNLSKDIYLKDNALHKLKVSKSLVDIAHKNIIEENKDDATEKLKQRISELCKEIRYKDSIIEGNEDSVNTIINIYNTRNSKYAKFMQQAAELSHFAESPGPYKVTTTHSYFLIVDRHSDVIARSLYEHVALLLCGLLNLAYHSQSDNIEGYQQSTN